MHPTNHARSRRRSAVNVIALATTVLTAMGCHRTTPTAPGPARISVEGTWHGTLTDRSGVESQLTMTVAGIEPSASGTFSLAFGDTSKDARGIVLVSTTDAPTIHLTLNIQQAGPACVGTPGVFYHARVAFRGNDLDGDYEPAFGCDILTRGAVRLTRR